MIKELNIEDVLIQNELVDTFKDLFSSCDQIKKDKENNPFIHYVGYYIEEEIKGILIYTLIYDRAEIVEIEVVKEKRKSGIASSMMEYLIDLCEQENIKNITLEVRENNLEAINLYQKYGFLKRAIRKNYYQGVDGILMEKEVGK